MSSNLKSNKEILEDLIDKIKGIKRITQGKISLLAGYESENYLSEAKSTDNVTENIVKAVRSLYEKAKLNPDILIQSNIYENNDRSMVLSEPIEQIINMKLLEKENSDLKDALVIMRKENIDLHKKIAVLEERISKNEFPSKNLGKAN